MFPVGTSGVTARLGRTMAAGGKLTMTRIAVLTFLALCLGCHLPPVAAETPRPAGAPVLPAGVRDDLHQNTRFSESPQSLWGGYRKNFSRVNAWLLNKRGNMLAVRGKVERESEGRYYIALRFGARYVRSEAPAGA